MRRQGLASGWVAPGAREQAAWEWDGPSAAGEVVRLLPRPRQVRPCHLAAAPMARCSRERAQPPPVRKAEGATKRKPPHCVRWRFPCPAGRGRWSTSAGGARAPQAEARPKRWREEQGEGQGAPTPGSGRRSGPHQACANRLPKLRSWWGPTRFRAAPREGDEAPSARFPPRPCQRHDPPHRYGMSIARGTSAQLLQSC